jgi:hypothetical protein
MRRQAGTIRAAVLLGGLALLIAGCGGSSNPSTSSTVSTTTTTTTTAATSSSAATTTTSGSSASGLLSSPNCRELLGLSQSFSQAMEGNATNLEKTAELVKQFADKAPSAIRPDFEVLAADYTKVASALKGYNLNSGKAPSAAVLAKLVTLSSQLDTEKLTQASQDISAWAHTNCGTTGG